MPELKVLYVLLLQIAQAPKNLRNPPKNHPTMIGGKG